MIQLSFFDNPKEIGVDGKNIKIEKKKVESKMSGYDKYEVVSALHKSLRLGNLEDSIYWGWKIWDMGRGKWYLQNYLVDICFEETWSLKLINVLIESKFNYMDLEFIDLVRLMDLFCKTPKKWEIPEIRKQLVIMEKEYIKYHSNDSIYKTMPYFQVKEEMMTNYSKKDYIKLGCKYANIMFFRKFNDRAELYNKLNIKKELENIFKWFLRPKEKKRFHWYLMQFIWTYNHDSKSYDYDGELENDYDINNIVFQKREIPLYALDKHTRRGKSLIYRDFPRPNKKQILYDIRYTGDFIGIIWRIQAMEQYNTINIPWEDIEWTHDFWEWVKVH